MNFKERYTPYAMAVNATLALPAANQLGGFIVTTSGVISITDDAGNALLTNHPVTAGQYLPLPMLTSRNGDPGVTVVLAGGASGCLLA